MLFLQHTAIPARSLSCFQNPATYCRFVTSALLLPTSSLSCPLLYRCDGDGHRSGGLPHVGTESSVGAGTSTASWALGTHCSRTALWTCQVRNSSRNNIAPMRKRRIKGRLSHHSQHLLQLQDDHAFLRYISGRHVGHCHRSRISLHLCHCDWRRHQVLGSQRLWSAGHRKHDRSAKPGHCARC